MFPFAEDVIANLYFLTIEMIEHVVAMVFFKELKLQSFISFCSLYSQISSYIIDSHLE